MFMLLSEQARGRPGARKRMLVTPALELQQNLPNPSQEHKRAKMFPEP